MRLRRLDLVRYGHFEGHSLDFGAGEGDCDVTVVFGPNEAGKSTAFTAWLDLLYGFPARNPPYAFRFDRKDLLVGAEIEANGTSLTLQRTPRKTDSLLDADGRALPEHLLSGHLYGLDRDAYRTRFSLDDEVLRAGGEEIAAAKGDLGRLLHAGTSGLAGLSGALRDVQADADAFYQKGGSKQAVPAAKRRLKELDATIRERRLAPLRHDDLHRAVTERRGAADDVRAALAEARRALTHAEAAATRTVLRLARERIADRLAEFPSGPDLPPDAVAQVAAQFERAREATRRRSAAEAARDDAAACLADLVPDPAGLELGPVIDDIRAMRFDDRPLLTRAEGAHADLDRRRSRRDTVRREAGDLARRISGKDVAPEAMDMDPETADRLDAALRDHSEAVLAARLAREALSEAREGHGEAPMVPQGDMALGDALDAMLAGAPDLDTLREEAAEAAAIARRAAEGVPSDWQTRMSEGGGLPAEGTVTAILAAAEGAVAQLSREDTRLAEARASCEIARSRLTAAEANPASVDVEALQRLRAAREAAWTTHRATLDTTTAESFEAALRADDAATAAHAAGAEARAGLLARRDELAVAEAALRSAQGGHTDATRQADMATPARGDLATRLLLERDAPPAEIRARHHALAAAFEAAGVRDAAAARLSRAEARHAELLNALSAALTASGGGEVAKDPVPAARRHLDALRAARAARADWEKRAETIALTTDRVERAEARLRDRRAALDATAAGSWADGLAPEAIRAALPDARRLGERLAELRELNHRIDTMEGALAAFRAASDLPRKVVGDHDSADALVRAAEGRYRDAQDVAQRIAAQTRLHAQSEEAIRSAEADARAARDAIAALLAGQARPEDADPPTFARHLAERDGLRADLARHEEEIARAAAGLDPARLAGEEALGDPARVPALADAVGLAEGDAAAADRALGAAEEALRGALDSDGAARVDQDRAALIEDLRAGARDAAARMIGLAAARSALHRLGEERRGPMLRDAEAAFATLTGGVWSRLDTWQEGQGERLVGISGANPVPADGMSTGTRAQLYLSLRIAGHAAFVREAGPLPFVTDDILESFDDGRAAAALDLTAELGRRGQAILFTHHAHLVEMARERIPGARVIELAPRA